MFFFRTTTNTVSGMCLFDKSFKPDVEILIQAQHVH